MNDTPSAGGRRPRVVLLFGGRSGEHAISCVTAAGVLRVIDRTRYDVLPVGITRSGRWVLAEDDPQRWSIVDGRLPHVPDSEDVVLPPAADGSWALLRPGSAPESLGPVDVVFPLLHGPFGEDGTVQGLLELRDTRSVRSGVLASALGMDKHVMKLVKIGS